METWGRILVVDDDESTRIGLRDVFETQGYRVEEAANGREALAALQRGPLPHVIILDIEMPGMNGVTFRLRQRREPDIADVPVIIHSSLPQSDTLASIMEASAFLTKPVDRSELLHTVRSVLAVGCAT